MVKYINRSQVIKAVKYYKTRRIDNAREMANRLGLSEAQLKTKIAELGIVLNQESEETSPTVSQGQETIIKEEKTTEILSDVDINIPALNKKNSNAIAVIIGNRNYLNNDVPEVTYAHRDAQTMQKYLINTLGYDEGNIIYLEDATQASFFSIFGNESTHKGKLYDYVKPDQSDVFIYYSGHGGPDPESKKAYFVPTDCGPSQLALNGYSLNTFYKNLSMLPYKTVTIVIDACFSGVSEGGALLKNISPIFINTEHKVKLDENAVIITASESDQVASWYPEKKHGLLSYFLMKAMQGDADKNKDKSISIEELQKYLSEEVSYWARRLHSREQSPEIWGNPITTFSTY